MTFATSRAGISNVPSNLHTTSDISFGNSRLQEGQSFMPGDATLTRPLVSSCSIASLIFAKPLDDMEYTFACPVRRSCGSVIWQTKWRSTQHSIITLFPFFALSDRQPLLEPHVKMNHTSARIPELSDTKRRNRWTPPNPPARIIRVNVQGDL